MDESVKYGESENLNMKQFISSIFILLIAGCSDSIPIEPSNPSTPEEAIYPIVENADMILVMSVEPGYSAA